MLFLIFHTLPFFRFIYYKYIQRPLSTYVIQKFSRKTIHQRIPKIPILGTEVLCNQIIVASDIFQK